MVDVSMLDPDPLEDRPKPPPRFAEAWCATMLTILVLIEILF